MRIGQADAVLEAQHGILDQRRVVDLGGYTARCRGAGEHEMARASGLVVQLEMALVKVPRTLSWPPRRTGVPSDRSDASARASAVAQVMPAPVSIEVRRSSRKRATFGSTAMPRVWR